ncbi:MAG TPA: hypothetical protein VFW87_09570, partial [Pirellulales bacterium]|nr:hypothetical protein [Pirellulales bacterium]
MATTGHSLDQGERTPQLRLFTPADLAAADADSPAGLWPGMSLSQFAAAYVLPYWLTERRTDQKTIGIYRQAIDRWSQLTCDPPLADIDDRTTSQFIAGLSGLPGRKAEQISPATIHKLCRAIQTCLNLAGPKTPQHRKAQRLISDVPYLEKPTLDEPEAGIDDNFELAEIAAILAACASMTTPRRDTYTLRVRGRSITVLGTGIDPPAFWRSLVTFAYNTGERKGALFAVA